MTRSKKILTVLLLLAVATVSVFAQAIFENSEYPMFFASVPSLEVNTYTSKYGNLNTNADAKDFFKAGFNWGDLVRVRFLDKELIMPVVPAYSYVDTGTAAVIASKDADGKPAGALQLAINMGDFTSTYGIATKTTNADKTFFWTAKEGVELPVHFLFSMTGKDGYRTEYLIRDLNRTNNREDYQNLTDEQFANFRKVQTTGMTNLYRSSNPVNAELGRNKEADTAAKAAGVTVVMNLADDRATAESRAEFAGSYYSTCKVIYLGLGVDFEAPEFKAGLAEGLRFFAANKGTYLVHCKEGKDRAGFVSALLECLKGATAREVAEDYMITYYNYYGVEKGSEKYKAIETSNIDKILANAFGVSDIFTADLVAGARTYMKSIGLSDAEIDALAANL